MDIYLGADWSKSDLVCGVAVEDRPPFVIKCKRALEAVKELVARLRGMFPTARTIHAIIEAGSPGWCHLLHEAGCVVHVVDPKQAKAFAESFCSSGAKDDNRDGCVLAEFGRSRIRILPIWTPADPGRVRLERLGAALLSVVEQITATQQRIRAMLREGFPALDAAIGKARSAWARRILRLIPTPWHAAQVSPEALEAALAGSGKAAREAVRAAVTEDSAPWLDEVSASGEARGMAIWLDQLDLLLQQEAALEEEISRLAEPITSVQLSKSIGGIGPRLSLRLALAGIEDAEGRDGISILMGASPVFTGSGKRRDGRNKGAAHMRRSAEGFARATTFLVGRVATRDMSWARAMYADARARGQKAAHAYRRIARSVYRILAAILRTGEPYDEARYIAALQSKGVPWAMELEAKAA